LAGWKSKKSIKEKELRNTAAAAAAIRLFFAGSAPAVFRYVTGAWRKTSGD
jgi:hypothetical protein